jgi:hypothetical protein
MNGATAASTSGPRPTRGTEYADSIAGDDAVIIRVAPGVVRAWDFADER